MIADPWSGWVAERPVVEHAEPSFGVFGRGLVRLTLWTRVVPYTETEKESISVRISFWMEGHDFLALSGISFGGELNAARPDTLRWCGRFKRWVSKTAVCLKPSHGQKFWAFPSAFQRLERRTKYYANGWNLDASIREAALQRTTAR